MIIFMQELTKPMLQYGEPHITFPVFLDDANGEKIPKITQADMFISACRFLREAYLSNDKDYSNKMIAFAKDFIRGHDCPMFWTFYDCLDLRQCWIRQCDRHNETYYQNLFKEHAEKVLDCKLIKNHKDDRHHKPDAWIVFCGKETPVEVKLNNFDTKALKQLQRYINFYKTSYGIAVARKCTVELSDNIIFVPLSKLEKLENINK